MRIADELSAKAFSNFKNVSQMAIECRSMSKEIIKVRSALAVAKISV